MSEKENIISPSDEVRIVNAFKYWYETNTEKGVTSIPDYICKGLLDLYNKEKEKNKNLQDKCIELEEENIKIKHLMRNPCDILRQIIIEKINKDMNTNEHTILGGRKYGKTLEYGIRLGRIQMCEELLQEGDK